MSKLPFPHNKYRTQDLNASSSSSSSSSSSIFGTCWGGRRARVKLQRQNETQPKSNLNEWSNTYQLPLLWHRNNHNLAHKSLINAFGIRQPPSRNNMCFLARTEHRIRILLRLCPLISSRPFALSLCRSSMSLPPPIFPNLFL